MAKRPLILLCTALVLAGCWDLAGVPPTGGLPTATPRAVSVILSPTPSITPEPTPTPTPTESPTLGTAAPAPTFPALSTGVQYVLFRVDTPIYSGPGTGYNQVSQGYKNQTAAVTGVSFDDHWWRIECPVGIPGSCWVSSDTKVTQATSKPKSSPGPTMLPTPTGTRSPSPLSTLESGKQYIVARTNVNVRRGPGINYEVLGQLSIGQVVATLARSPDGHWWQIACPGGGSTDCWVSADAPYTQPVTAPPGGIPTPTAVRTAATPTVAPSPTAVPTAATPTAAPSPTKTPVPTTALTQTPRVTSTPGGQYIRALRNVNIRNGPGTLHPIVGVLGAGTTVPTAGLTPDGEWWQIACPGAGSTCYVSSKSNLTQAVEQP